MRGDASGGGETTPRSEAIRLLARREYSRQELAERLAAKGHDAEAIAECLASLVEQGLQSDERFAEGFLRSRILRGQGPLKIRLDLERRGLDREVIRHAFDEAARRGEGDWFALACEALARRFPGPGDTPRERARRERFLAGRGFDFDQVRHALDAAWSTDA
ncbi:regulatory protein RecX [Halomonas urmiana]|uniref:Regulatory protein RecX n=1 Tax=Halomonas urmiana TaxID=490901 RepID=A0A5R8MDK0_9GAMM|nr:regulatory protein RecX [Halomonas urmiana]TLF47642.1 regulatory protein RecX [Halomonas urmiana]